MDKPEVQRRDVLIWWCSQPDVLYELINWCSLVLGKKTPSKTEIRPDFVPILDIGADVALVGFNVFWDHSAGGSRGCFNTGVAEKIPEKVRTCLNLERHWYRVGISPDYVTEGLEGEAFEIFCRCLKCWCHAAMLELNWCDRNLCLWKGGTRVR